MHCLSLKTFFKIYNCRRISSYCIFEKSILFPNWFYYLPIYIRTAIPVGIFYFVLFLINPEHKLSSFEKIGYVLIGTELLLAFIYIPLNITAETVEESETIEYLIIIEDVLITTRQILMGSIIMNIILFILK